MKVDLKLVREVLSIVDRGLSIGITEYPTDEICVETAICRAMGLSHEYDPPGNLRDVWAYSVSLNDAPWSSKAARAAGMRKLAVAQLGSGTSVDGKRFTELVVEGSIRRLMPIALNAAATLLPATQGGALREAALHCEREGTKVAADDAYCTVRRMINAVRPDASRAIKNAELCCFIWETEFRDEKATQAGLSARYAAVSVCEATAGGHGAKDRARDDVFFLAAEIGLSALIACGSTGCKWLHICEGPA